MTLWYSCPDSRFYFVCVCVVYKWSKSNITFPLSIQVFMLSRIMCTRVYVFVQDSLRLIVEKLDQERERGEVSLWCWLHVHIC